MSSDGPGATGSNRGSRLDRAAHSWMKNGYTVRYRDRYLVQLVKRRRPNVWLLVPLAVLGFSGSVLFIMLVRRLLRERWHVVELTVTPDWRIIMHKMWAPRPPED